MAILLSKLLARECREWRKTKKIVARGIIISAENRLAACDVAAEKSKSSFFFWSTVQYAVRALPVVALLYSVLYRVHCTAVAYHSTRILQ